MYEIFTIVRPSLSEEEVASFVEELEKRIEDGTTGASVVGRKVERDQTLAYPISKQLRGHFVHLEVHVTSGEELSEETSREMQHNEHVLRYLLFRKSPELVRTYSSETSVIDRMRTQQPGTKDTGDHKRAPAPPAPEEKGEMDVAEVDKKIEELIN